MIRWIPALAGVALLAALTATPAHAQAPPPTVTVSIYRVAPGQHLAFLEWMAAQEDAARAAGAPATQWYVHMDGDAWDYVGIGPSPSDEMQSRIDEILRQRGRKTGFQAGLEFRRHITWHTDTEAWGPTTIQEILTAARP